MNGSQAVNPLQQTLEGAKYKQESPISTTHARFRHPLTSLCAQGCPNPA